MSAKIHPTAIIHPDAQVDSSCVIGPFCVIGPNARLGPGNRLISHVVVENRVTIGEGNTIFPFAVLGAVPQDLKYKGEPTELVVGDRNSIRESATLNIGTEGGGGVTKVGDDNLLMAYVHLGHDTKVGNKTVIANSCQIAGHVTIGDYAIVGGLCGISQFTRLGEHCYVGGCSGVDRDVLPYSYGKGPTGHFENLGINFVGLKRRGFDERAIATLREIDKMFIKDKSLERDVALKKIEDTLGAVEVARQFVGFVRASEIGVYR